MSEAGSLSFSIEGEIITDIAREHFYVSNDLSKALELLMASLQSDQLDKYQRMAIALQILDGKAEIVGTYPDGNYRVVDVDNPDSKFNIEEHFNDMANKLKQAEGDLNDTMVKYSIVSELLDEDQMHSANIAWLQTNPDPYQPLFMIDRERSTLADILKDEIDNEEAEPDLKYADYGWIEPNGDFHPVEFAMHEEYAYKTIKERGWWDEYDLANMPGIYAHGDFLVQRKGWVLLHNPYGGNAFVLKNNTKSLSKAQKEFLFDYYMERNMPNEASMYFRD